MDFPLSYTKPIKGQIWRSFSSKWWETDQVLTMGIIWSMQTGYECVQAFQHLVEKKSNRRSKIQHCDMGYLNPQMESCKSEQL